MPNHTCSKHGIEVCEKLRVIHLDDKYHYCNKDGSGGGWLE